jgi:hypothetical protein
MDCLNFRSKEDYDKFLLERNIKLEKFNSDTASDKAQKEVAFSEKVFVTSSSSSVTSIPTIGTEKQGIELKPVEFETGGGKLYNKFGNKDKDDDEYEEEGYSEHPRIMKDHLVTRKQGFDPRPDDVTTFSTNFDPYEPEPPKSVSERENDFRF